jgi:hypothetical protein
LLVDSILAAIVSHVTLLASIVIFRCDFRLSNSVLRAKLFYSYVVLAELEERRDASVLDIGQVPARNFDWLSFTLL